MKYDSLMLNCGGGIINPATKSPQFSGSAALCIGIGGTGIAALSDLKGKIYQQLEPDNPGEPVPRYDAIQLLGIDSDDGAYRNYGGNRRLNNTEFFSIKKDNLADFFTKAQGKQLIKDDPMMSWMEIDEITALLSPEGAGGIRQMGRYLLLSKASMLETEIAAKCNLALTTRGSQSLDIYIFAGISGGTGSGCFLDTCYLVRKVVDANGWNAKIMGFFFLPDVVTSKKEVSSNPASIAYNNSNGYAAMKELDYLMHMEENGDEFVQNYGSSTFRTKMPPVDMCHLISAQKADGSMVPDGFHYGINVASDYAIAYMAYVALNGANADESSLTMRGHLANVTRGVQGIPRRWGANLSYHVLGACNAEIPMTQINTYLASGFFQKFSKEACVPRNAVTKNAVQKLMQELQLGVGQVYNAVVANTRELHLPDIDRKQLAQEPVCAKGKLPRTWADFYNNWLAECDGTMVTNGNGLTKKLEGFAYQDINVQSLVGRLFRKLWDMSIDPAYGPYYAAYLLKNNGDDLFSALTGEIVKADGQEEAKRIQLPDMEDWIIQLNQNLVDRRGRTKDYEAYYRGVTDYLNTEMARLQCHKTGAVLRVFRSQVEELYNTFFRPLTEMLDNLQETFRENSTYLETPEAKHTNAYTWQILTLDEIKPNLDHVIEELKVTQLVGDFVQNLLRDSANWLKNDENKISLQICKFMLELFEDQANRSLQDYLFDKYPATQGDVSLLTKEIENDILQRVHRSATPMFWCDPTYSITDPTYTFESSSLSVPSSCAAICSAANNFNKSHNSYTVRQTGISGRIFALRFVSGIPLFAYQGITKLKHDYDAAQGKAAGAGSHLYAATGRGTSNVDWRSYIPTPMPYSKKTGMEMHSEGEHWAAVYRDAVSRGIIGIVPKDTFEAPAVEAAGDETASKKSQNDSYAIFITPPLEVKNYSLQDFMIGEVFDQAKYDAELAMIQKQTAELHDFTKNPNCSLMRLKNDGDQNLCHDVESVRIDYFVQYTVMHKVVVKEIEKDKALKAAQQQLLDIYNEYFGYETDLKSFADLLFRGVLECRNVSDELDYEQTQSVLCAYTDHYGDPQQCYLVKNAEEFALCHAFACYRQKMGGNSEAWDMVEKTLDELKDAATKAQDVYAAAILEKVWDDRAMAKLREKGLQGKSQEVAVAVLRFYNGLRTNIKRLKTSLGKNWPKDKTLEELTALVSGESPAAPVSIPAEVDVWYNGEWMKVYPLQWPEWAVNVSTNNWVKLNPAVQVWNGQQLVPIKLDENNRIKF